MTKRLVALLIAAVPALAFAAAGPQLQSAPVNLKDQASLQRGAALFMSYCAGCHSLDFQRYSRIAEDLEIPQEMVEKQLIVTSAKFGETIGTSMSAADGETWFGKAPPDLSVVARAKLGGPDWTYTFLKSFYVDETRPSGWNNTVLPGASMPNVLWELQGPQRAVYDAAGQAVALEKAGDGAVSEAEYEQTVRDITNFLTYVGEPSAMKRTSMGVWVILFLAAFTFLAWLLKKEYWRDVH